MIVFEWDDSKANTNLKKHGVSFEEAKTVFYDDFARIIPDPDHSDLENRFIIQGLSFGGKLIVISFTERGETIRLINARKATKKERSQYEESI